MHTRYPCWRTSVFTVGALQCSLLAHKRVHRWRMKVFIVGAKACPLSAQKKCPLSTLKCVHCRRTKCSLLAHKRAHRRRTRVSFNYWCKACSPSARKCLHCWRISTPTVGFQECSLLAHKRVDSRRAQLFLDVAGARRRGVGGAAGLRLASGACHHDRRGLVSSGGLVSCLFSAKRATPDKH